MAGLREEDIGNFGTFTNTLHEPEIAKDYLRHNNYDLEKALDEWYTRGQNPDLYKGGINQEPLWQSGEYGPANQMQAMPPESWDWAPPPEIHVLGTDPMSRPPSRTNQALAEHIAWAAQDQSMAASAGNDDVEMRQALERSQRDYETVSSIGPSTSSSPPISARRDGNSDKPTPRVSPPWRQASSQFSERMAPRRIERRHRSVVRPPDAPKKVSFYIPGESLTQPTQKVLDPEPRERSRQIHAPAFLKPLPNGDFLPSFITILHSIPKCRKELLSVDDLLPEYIYNERWWGGESIEAARIILSDQASDVQPGKEMIHEIQRLMAFLDKTNRSYGSVEPLTRILRIGHIDHMEPEDVRFIRAWDSISASAADNTPDELGSWNCMFSSKLVSASNIQNLTQRDEFSRRILLTSEHVPDRSGVTIYDVLDRAILGDPTAERMWMHEQFAPVIVMHLHSGPKPRRMQVPATLFVDRYLEQNAEFIKSSRTLILQEISKAEEISSKISKLQTFKHPQPFKEGDATKLLSTTMAYLTQRSASVTQAMANGDVEPSEAPSDENALKAKRVLDQLESITNRVKEHLNNLNEQKNKCEENVKAYSKCGTDPDDPQFPASVRYQLRGFATTGYQRPSVTYVIYPMRKFGQNGLLGSREEPQWWRLVYDTRWSAHVRIDKVSEAEVLDAASEINYNAMLVYVHDNFLESTGQVMPLPSQLMDFVDRDNEAFSSEMNEGWGGPQVLEGVPVEGNPAWDSPDSDTIFGEPGPALDEERNVTTDPTMVVGDEGLPQKMQEMEEVRRDDPLSPKKRKKSIEGDSDMETMAPDSDVEMSR